MRVEVLLSTVGLDESVSTFLEERNINSDIIIGNQCDKNENVKRDYDGKTVVILSRSERGVGKNRNTSLHHSTADIVIFADNDVCYDDGYCEIVERYYQNNPDADVVIFNFKEQRGDEPIHNINTKDKKAVRRDLTKFGTFAITAKRLSLLKKRISFSLLFGGGAPYSCGEDSLFLMDCYDKGLNIYLSSETLGSVIHRESTWYSGINRKYIYDKGAILRAMFPTMYIAIILLHVWKHRKLYTKFSALREVLRIMFKGAKDYDSRSVL